MITATRAAATPDLSDGRLTGIFMAAASLLSIAIMAHHPSVGSHDMADVAAEIAQKATIDRFVHGTLIALLGVLMIALARFSALVPSRGAAQAASIAFSIGAGAEIAAALISGFVVSGLGERYVGAPEADLAALRHLLVFAMRANQAAAGFGVTAISIAIALWSLALLRSRVLVPEAVFGIVLGLATVATLLSGLLRLHVHGMMLVVAAEALWYLAIAAALIRRRFPASAQPLTGT